jgi:hypothetical protein
LCFAQIDENVAREIINHRSLRHPNIIQFIEVRMGNVIWYIVYYSRFLGLIGCFFLGGEFYLCGLLVFSCGLMESLDKKGKFPFEFTGIRCFSPLAQDCIYVEFAGQL